MRVLAIVAHHDDEAIGCGGTLLRHAQNGDVTSVVYITAGLRNVPLQKGKKAVQTIETEARAAARRLGVTGSYFLREPDRFVRYSERPLKKVIRCIRKIDPHVIYTHHESDLDVDHSSVYRIVTEASWLAHTHNFPECGDPTARSSDLLLFEVWTPIQRPNLFVDITEVFNQKLAAVLEYESPLSAVRYDAAVEGLNRYRGVMSRAGKYAEAFLIKRISEGALFSGSHA